jgi:hypothetical protein
MSDRYTITLNQHTATHESAESAFAAWEKISQACEDGRSIIAEMWRHSRHDWDETFYLGLLNPDGTVSKGIVAIKGKCIIINQCIAALTYP